MTICRLLYRQIMRNCRQLGWDTSQGVALMPSFQTNSVLQQVKYYWDLEWGEGYSQGILSTHQPRPELHSLLYEVKNGILYDDEEFLDLLFKINKETGEWGSHKKELSETIGGSSINDRADKAELASTQIYCHVVYPE